MEKAICAPPSSSSNLIQIYERVEKGSLIVFSLPSVDQRTNNRLSAVNIIISPLHNGHRTCFCTTLDSLHVSK